MRWIGFLVLWTWVAGLVVAEESDQHQRIGMEAKPDHRWEVGFGASLVPWGPGSWDLSMTPRLSYQYAGTWEGALSVSYAWAATENGPGVLGRWGDGLLSLSWNSRGSEPQWRLATGLAGPATPGKGPESWRWSGEIGVSLVRDPAVLAASLRVAVPWPNRRVPLGEPEWTAALVLALQEVLNDTLVASLSFVPGVRSVHGRISGSVSITWGVGWFDGPFSASTDLDSGTGQPWGWSVSAARSW